MTDSPARTRAIRQNLATAALVLGGVVVGRRVQYVRNGEDFECYLSEFSDSIMLRKHIKHVTTEVEVSGIGQAWVELSFAIDHKLDAQYENIITPLKQEQH